MIGLEEERPEMSPVSKLTGSPGLDVTVWSAVSSFFNTIVLFTPITRTKSWGEKLTSLIPEPAGAMIVIVTPPTAGPVGGVGPPPTADTEMNLGCSPGIISTAVIDIAIMNPATARTASAGLLGSIASCSLKSRSPLVHKRCCPDEYQVGYEEEGS